MLTEQQADDQWAHAASFPAKPTSWGFFSYIDIAPGLCGAGMGGFTWLDSAEEFFNFLVRVVPASTRMQPDKKQAAASAIQATIDSQGTIDAFALDAIREAANGQLVNHLQIDWVGSYQDLLHGDDRYALFVRARFHESQDEDEEGDAPEAESVERDSPLDLLRAKGRPITPDQEEDFADFLAEWGL
jgi:hypothetical protein